MKNSNYSVEILVSGRPVREFNHVVNGESRIFIEGRQGTQYSIRITNHSSRRILAIASVDGLSVVDGEIGDGFKGRGYIIPANQSRTINGFRESDDTVGAFQFTTKENSYAEEKGLGRNVGVIACNIIDEKVKDIDNFISIDYPKPLPPSGPDPFDPWSPKYPKKPESYWADNSIPIGTSDSMQTRCCSFSAPVGGQSKKASLSMGTKWGERKSDKIVRAHFDKNQIVASFTIYYGSREDLENMGIKFYEEKEINLPNGFEGYCKAPQNWKG